MPSYRTLARSLTLPLLVAALALAPRPAAAVKVMTYNLLNYPSASGAAREDEFRTILQATHPDVMIAQELSTVGAQAQFLANVLNVIFPGEYAVGTFFNGPDTNNGFFYRTAVFDFVSADTIATNLRCITHTVVRLDGYSGSGGELHLYSAHLKASATAADQAQRLEECTRWRNRTNLHPAGTNFIGGGDFNMQASTETAYQKLIGSEADNDGRFFDPINVTGTWNNNSGLAWVHTQSPKNASNPYGGATGGMDDRFDFLLCSSSLVDAEGMSYITGTYDPYGNDGLHCCNAALNDPPTIPEGAAMANALTEASDHLPVILELQVPAKVNTLASLPFGSVIVGAVATQNLTVSNTAVAPADELSYSLVAPAGFTVPGGPFTANAGAGANNHTVTMLTASAGVKAGNLAVNSDDVDFPSKTVALSGTVLNHASPSASGVAGVYAGLVDFGAHDPGGFADLAAAVHNAGYNSLQARLDVYGASITGPDAARFSIVGGFSPALVSGSPASWNIHFDDTGASAASYTATLTFTTRDETLPGSTNLTSVTWDLTATVNSQTGVGEGEPAPMATRLIGNYPNPFAPYTRISFELSQAGPVRLEVFDITGRLVNRLLDQSMDQGRYQASWDGQDSQGREMASGRYFYRLETLYGRETRSMTLLR